MLLRLRLWSPKDYCLGSSLTPADEGAAFQARVRVRYLKPFWALMKKVTYESIQQRNDICLLQYLFVILNFITTNKKVENITCWDNGTEMKFFFSFFFSKRRDTERQRVLTDKHKSPIHWLMSLNAIRSWGWARPKAGARNSICLSPTGLLGAQLLRLVPTAFQDALSADNWDQEQSLGTEPRLSNVGYEWLNLFCNCYVKCLPLKWNILRRGQQLYSGKVLGGFRDISWLLGKLK